MTDSSDKPGDGRLAGTSPTPSDSVGAPTTSAADERGARLESTRFEVGPVVAALDAKKMRASIGARLFGASADPVRFGRYTILKRLGAGAMGVVYAAFDPQLDRKVALKILKDSLSSSEEKGRLLTEAQALAKLSHPNVVQVFEAGECEGQVYIAMEFVEGTTLREWKPDASSREVFEVFIGAARGLNAAHEKGLVHRDFKPDNVMVSEDGRARVLDFGLARGMDSVVEAPEIYHDAAGELALGKDRGGENSRSAVLTGSAAGTPAYMAPEQFQLRPLTEATDQFAFCVTMWERLAGERPFTGDSLLSLETAVSEGQIQERRARDSISLALRRVLRRGLSADDDQRWPSMAALIEELERVQARPRRVRLVAAGATAMAALVVFGARVFGAPTVDPCVHVKEEAASLWSEQIQRDVEARFVNSSLPFATDAWATIQGELAVYASRWEAAQTAACQRSNAADVTDREIGLRQSLCLAQRKASLEEVAKMLRLADDTLIERATDAVNRLPDLSVCADAAGLGAWSPPESESQRLELEDLNTALARAESALTFYRYEEAAALLGEALGAIEAAGHEPTLARAYLLSGRIFRRLREADKAVDNLQKARRLGDRLGDDFLRARALVELVRVVGYDLANFDEGLNLADDASAAIGRLGGNPLLTADLENYLGSLYRRRGSLGEARQHHTRAMEIFSKRLGEGHPETAATLRNLGIVAATQNDFVTAGEAFERSLETVRGRVGDNHPAVARELSMMGNLDLLRARTVGDAQRRTLAKKSRSRFERVIEIQSRVYGPDDLRLDDAFHNLGLALMLAEEFEGGREALSRALELTSRRLRDDHPDVIETKAELGDCLVQLGRLEEGEALLTEVLRSREAAGAKGRSIGAVRLSLAERFLDDDPDHSRELLGTAMADFGPVEKLQLLDKERISALAAALGFSLSP